MKKLLNIALIVCLSVGALARPPAPMPPHHGPAPRPHHHMGKGEWIAAGLIGGLAIGSAIAGEKSQPAAQAVTYTTVVTNVPAGTVVYQTPVVQAPVVIGVKQPKLVYTAVPPYAYTVIAEDGSRKIIVDPPRTVVLPKNPVVRVLNQSEPRVLIYEK